MGDNKKLEEMTEKEILRKQFELLAEASKSDYDNLPSLTQAMIVIYDRLAMQFNNIPCEKSIKPGDIGKKARRINEQLSEGKMSVNQARKEYGLKPIEGGDIIAKIQPDSNNEPIEIKGPKRDWFNLYESGIEIQNENIVKNVINLLLESGLNYLEMNRVLRDADGALRHKTFSTVLGQSNKPNYIPYGHSESDFTKL
jgi:hypothetical protein